MDNNELKVMTFNMKRNYFSYGRNQWKFRVERIHNIIKRYEPDIIGTQELLFSGLEEMKRQLIDYEYVGYGRNGGDRGEYTAIFYRRDKFVVHKYDTFWLSKTPDKPSLAWLALFPRTCTMCCLSVIGEPEKRLGVFNTHLDHMSYFSRIKSLELITNRIEEAYHAGNTSIILMGDFNATKKSKTLHRWNKRDVEFCTLTKADADGCSYHGYHEKTNGNAIDHIYVGPNLRIMGAEICRDRVNNYFPSDHYPVVARIAW